MISLNRIGNIESYRDRQESEPDYCLHPETGLVTAVIGILTSQAATGVVAQGMRHAGAQTVLPHFADINAHTSTRQAILISSADVVDGPRPNLMVQVDASPVSESDKLNI